MATFGYTTQGGSNTAFVSNGVNATRFTAPADVGVVSKLTVYGVNPDTSGNVKGCIWKQSDLSLVAVSNAATITGGLLDLTFSSPPTLTPNIDYYLGTVSESGGSLRPRVAYNSNATTNYGIDNQANSYTSPTSLSGNGTTTKQYTVYATYTPSGGATGFNIALI